MNQNYQVILNFEDMVDYCFRTPEDEEQVKPILTNDIVKQIADEFPNLKTGMSTCVKVGKILKSRN